MPASDPPSEPLPPATDPGEDQGAPYTREELRLVGGHAFPERGLRCHRCRTFIPRFADLSPTGEARLHELIRQGRQIMATKELIAETGCSLRWAKIWVVHDGRPGALVPGTPCPLCGKPLRTSRARQCPHCGADWHRGPVPRRE